MVVAKKKEAVSTELQVVQVKQGVQDFCILGATPLIYNAMSFKMKTELSTGLLPKPPKNKAARTTSLKHEIFTEYRDSCYYMSDDGAPTRLMLPSRMFKRALVSVCARIPGIFQTEAGQLLSVQPEEIALFGVPQMYITDVRSADQNRTPDMRTRALVPEWACKIRIYYVQPNINSGAVVNLLGNAGLLCGVGDYRVEKGRGNYGMFHMVDENNAEWQRIVNDGTRDAQLAALARPEYYDAETDALATWYIAERRNREGKYEPFGDTADRVAAE